MLNCSVFELIRVQLKKKFTELGRGSGNGCREGIGRALPYIGYGVKRAFGGGKASTAAAYDQLIKSGIKTQA